MAALIYLYTTETKQHEVRGLFDMEVREALDGGEETDMIEVVAVHIAVTGGSRSLLKTLIPATEVADDDAAVRDRGAPFLIAVLLTYWMRCSMAVRGSTAVIIYITVESKLAAPGVVAEDLLDILRALPQRSTW
ncbi:hypothetical protein GP486_007840 [Trichoglossum hirsutum]|uniref:Uncharacterized protein n=1 Tax=Trichoglossum hirsutum TaxID=265104 RepID=A0A9P8L6N1_9PEZI|nr:hypothetical protein GP486_007840 [Trichoglossum hirsutum]